MERLLIKLVCAFVHPKSKRKAMREKLKADLIRF